MQFVTLATDGNRYLSLDARRNAAEQRKALAAACVHPASCMDGAIWTNGHRLG